MSGWTREIRAQGSTAERATTFRDSLATAGKCELYAFRRAEIRPIYRRGRSGQSGASCAAIGASQHLDPVCRVHRSRSAGLEKRPGDSVVPPQDGFGAVPGVLPSMGRACIRLREIPERGDSWRSHRCRSQTGTPPRALLGKPALLCVLHCPAADSNSGESVVSRSTSPEEVAVVRGTHWK
jgi:hypothetical protein